MTWTIWLISTVDQHRSLEMTDDLSHPDVEIKQNNVNTDTLIHLDLVITFIIFPSCYENVIV